MMRLPLPHMIRPSLPKDALLMVGTSMRQAYHLGDADQPQQAWCGARAETVEDGDISTWGQCPEGQERYCPQCAALARKHHVVLGPASPNRSLWRLLTPA